MGANTCPARTPSHRVSTAGVYSNAPAIEAMTEDTVNDPTNPPDATSVHVQRAGNGHQGSVAWIVARFTPFLRMQAEYRLRGGLRRIHDPEDLVNEVWAVILPRFGVLRDRDGHLGPVLMKYLSTTLLNKANNLMMRYVRSGQVERSSADGVAADVTSVTARAARDEAAAVIAAAIERLGPRDHEILILHGIEQVSTREIARKLDLQASAVSMRFARALERLRALLPDGIGEELPFEEDRDRA